MNRSGPRLLLVGGALVIGWLLPDRDAMLMTAPSADTPAVAVSVPAAPRWAMWPKERGPMVEVQGRRATIRPLPSAGDDPTGACAYLGMPEGRVFVPAAWSVQPGGGSARLFLKVVRDGKPEVVPVAATREALPVTRVSPEVDSTEAHLYLCLQLSGAGTTATLEVGDG